MKLLELEQGSDEWLEKRRGSITGTDASIIMGVNPFKTRKDLLKEKLALTTPILNDAMKMGQELEPRAREVYMIRENIIVYPAVVVHDDYFWAMASLDGISEAGDLILEIKCGKSAFEKAQNKEIPPYYYAQMQHCMWVSDTQKCHYFCFWDGKGILQTVVRDNNYIKKMVEEEIKFYDEMLFTSEKDLETILDDREELKLLLDEYEQAKEREAHYTALKESFRQSIIDLCESKDTEAFGYKITKSVRRGQIQYSKIPELKNIDLEAYRSDSLETWTIKKGKDDVN